MASIPAENLVYCVCSVQKIIDQKLDFVFTDGHAVDRFSTQFSQSDIENIVSVLDMNAINGRYWKDENDLHRKRRKEAELLVLGDIMINGILGYLVQNQNAKTSLVNFGVNAKHVHIKPDYYFQL